MARLVVGLITLALCTCAAHEDADAVVPEQQLPQVKPDEHLSQEVADGIAKDWVKAWMGIAKTCTAKHPQCEALRLLYKANVVLICAGFCNPKPQNPMPTFTWMHGGRHASVKPFDNINDLTNPQQYVVEARPQGNDAIHVVYHMVGCGQVGHTYRGYNRLERGPSGSWTDARASIDVFPFPATAGKTAARRLLESTTTTSPGSKDETKRTDNPESEANPESETMQEAALFSEVFTQIMNDDMPLRDDNMNRVYEADAVVIDMSDPKVKPEFQTPASSVHEADLHQTVVEAQGDKNDDGVIHLIYSRTFQGGAYRGYSRLQKCQTHGDWKIAVDMYPLPTPGAKGPHHFPVPEGV